MGAKIVTYSFIGLLWLCTIAGAQAPDTLWSKLYGGPGNDYGYWLDITRDGGFVVVGSYFWEVGNTDFFLVKTDENGDTLWTNILGGYYYDVCRWVHQTPDDGYFVAGLTSSENNTQKDIYIFKTDSLGNVLWTRSYGGDQEDGVVTAQPTSDDGYILIGYTASFGLGSMDIWLLKLDANGDTLWTKTYGDEFYDYAGSVIQMPDSGYFVLCNTIYGVDNRLTLIRTDANGDSLWSRRYLAVNTSGESIIATSDGAYMILANTLDFGDEFDIQLLKINEDGDSLWTQVIGGLDIDMGNSIQQTADDGYVICGITGPYFDQDLYVVRTDVNGNVLWSSTFNGTSYGNDMGTCAKPTPDGGIILTGSLSTGDAMQDVCLIRFESDQVGNESNSLQLPIIHLSQNYPNPFNSSTTIEFSMCEPQFVTLAIYDLQGREVCKLLEQKISAGTHKINFNMPGLSSGVYFYQMKTERRSIVDKMILLK